MRRGARLARLLPFSAVAVVILASGLNSEPVPELFTHQDKLHHLAGFAALSLTARLAFPRLAIAWLVAWTLSAALLIELGQGLLPLRTPSLGDMLANALGVASGLVFARLVERCSVTGSS